VADRVRFERGNVLETDVRKATVVTLYLLPPIVQGLRAGLLRQLRPGSRIVSHDFPFEGWQADATETFFAPEKNSGRGGDSSWRRESGDARLHDSTRAQQRGPGLARGARR
jgi:hypothetical protein